MPTWLLLWQAAHLTLFYSYFPGHIHAFYLEYVYYHRKDEQAAGFYDNRPAAGVYSDNVQTGGRGYGTIPATN